MAKLEVLHFPDARLRKKAVAVKEVDDNIRELAADMLETMYSEGGIGLAAIQVNVRKRVVVIDLSEERNSPMCLVNPEILTMEGTEQSREGCLSVPEYYDYVERAEKITFSYTELNNQTTQVAADGLLAVCVQHEVDHLNGKLFIDRISSLKRHRLNKKITKQEKLKVASL